jgi:P27 family predicted phage terminase small subunit
MPPTKKPAGQAVNPRNGRRAELATVSSRLAIPAIDRDAFLPASLRAWDAYWSDPVAASQTPADVMLVELWIEAYDDYRRKKAAADEWPMSEGSMGQQVANPLYAVAKDAMAIVMQCAKQLGIGAKNRADLGIALLSEKAALDDVNARYIGAGVDDDDDDDPRIIRIDRG